MCIRGRLATKQLIHYSTAESELCVNVCCNKTGEKQKKKRKKNQHRIPLNCHNFSNARICVCAFECALNAWVELT